MATTVRGPGQTAVKPQRTTLPKAKKFPKRQKPHGKDRIAKHALGGAP